MLYNSTRGGENGLRASEAILKGLASDGGLFMPEKLPVLTKSLSELSTLSYQDLAYEIMKEFFTDFTEEELRHCICAAYDEKFEDPKIAPLVKKGGAWYLELFHGKTIAFKDMALSILPHLMVTSARKNQVTDRIVILTATSGDTGKAAMAGFADVPGTEIIVFYPYGGVSRFQELQMRTEPGKNTHAAAIRGNFDDAQTGVKQIFHDPAFAQKLKAQGVVLSSANSINIGRLIPQVAYYVYGYAKLVERGVISDGDKINIVVPTGNFGNILAAYYAGKMGIPVNRFICASNENNVLTDFFNTGVYDINREFYLTNSPSMDILISSNLERLLYHLAGNDGAEIRSLMEALDTKKKYEVSETIRNGMKDFYGGCANVEETNEAVGRMYRENGYLMDTHTAVAYKVYEDYVKETGDRTPALIASTASAYKFADSVAHSIGLGDEENGFEYVRALAEKTGVRVPAGLKDLDKKEIRHRGVIKVSEMPEAVENSVK